MYTPLTPASVSRKAQQMQQRRTYGEKVRLDKDGERILEQKDTVAIEEYNRNLEEQRKREKKLFRHYEWQGNKLPPFSIEPMPHERQRLEGAGMTPEDRALRRQWLKDQELAPNEPRYIPELYPKNPFRRAYNAPWDILFRALRPILGEERATNWRWLVPKVFIFIGGTYVIHYYSKYNSGFWDDKHGWQVMRSKIELLNGEMPAPYQHNDQGFKDRKVLTDMKTSTPVVNS